MKTKSLILFLVCLTVSACGGSPATGGTGGGSSGTGGGGAGGGSAVGTNGGSCATPQAITLPFSATGTTASNVDTTSLTCGTTSNLAEAVYSLSLNAMNTVHVTGSDESGSGIGFQVHQSDCSGASQTCSWQSNGVLDSSITLPAGNYVIVVERNPAGKFSIAFE